MAADVERAALDVEVLAGIVVCHALALLALFPAFFSWTGVVVLVAGVYLFGVVGIGVGFHRLITHRGFSCSAWLENILTIFGTCSLQYSPAYWVAVHRRHHHFSDEEKDPHSPLKGFFRSHLGWMILPTADMKHGPMIDRYARDVLRKPLNRWLDADRNWIKVGLLSWLVLFGCAVGGAWVSGSSPSAALWFGVGVLPLGWPLETGHRVAHDLVGQFGDPLVRISQLQYRRYQPQQCPRRASVWRGRLAQQSPRGPGIGPARAQVVGVRPGVADHQAAGAAGPSDADYRSVHAAGQGSGDSFRRAVALATIPE